MTFHVLDRSENAAGWLLSIILTPICILATVLRFVATRKAGREYAWDDWFALAALIFYIPFAVYLLMILSYANGRDVTTFVKQDPKDWITMAKYGLMMNGLYGFQQTFAKWSLLALYYRLFWVKPVFVKMVWGVAIVQGMWGIVVLLCHIFACVPVRKSWEPTVKGTCLNINLFFDFYEPINAALDFIVAGMAVWVLWKLSFHRNTKRLWGVSILFVIGAFSGIVGLIKVAEAQHAAKRNYHSVIWNLVQMATSIICCCAPIYRSIAPMSLLNSLGSWASRSTRSKSSSSGTKKDSKGSATKNTVFTKFQDRNDSHNRPDASWMQLDRSSERGLTWGEAGVANGKTPSEDGRMSEEKETIPMRTIRIEKTVDVV